MLSKLEEVYVKEVNKALGEYSYIIIPDTQMIAKSYPEMFERMAAWIVRHAESLNLKMAMHLGDVVNDGAADEAQYRRAKAALDVIDQSKIPMLIVPGNHDYDNMMAEDRSSRLFNAYFGIERYRNEPWFGGAFEQGKSENCYARLEINGEQKIILALEFGPRDEVLSWADRILQTYRDHEAIIITHCYMYTNGKRSRPGDAYNPKLFQGAIAANDGEDMWQKCFRKHGNISAVYSGHQIPEYVSYRMDRGDQQNPVFQSFQNWQSAPYGGAGRMRISVYRPLEHKVDLYVLNPLTDEYENDPGYQLSYPLSFNRDSRLEWNRVIYPSIDS